MHPTVFWDVPNDLDSGHPASCLFAPYFRPCFREVLPKASSSLPSLSLRAEGTGLHAHSSWEQNCWKSPGESLRKAWPCRLWESRHQPVSQDIWPLATCTTRSTTTHMSRINKGRISICREQGSSSLVQEKVSLGAEGRCSTHWGPSTLDRCYSPQGT